MKITLPGFPTQISEEIQFPDMAELLTYPFFGNAPLDIFMSEASEFQRYLLSKAPLKFHKKYVTIYSGIMIQTPNQYRGLTSGYGDSHGWHLDGDFENPYDYISDNKDLVHLIQTNCESLTEFSEFPIHIDTKDDKTYTFDELSEWMYDKHSELNLRHKKVPPNRFVTFTHDHYHRALFPSKHEFRYVMRIRETDWEQSKFASGKSNVIFVTDTHKETDNRIPQIIKQNNQINLIYPTNFNW